MHALTSGDHAPIVAGRRSLKAHPRNHHTMAIAAGEATATARPRMGGDNLAGPAPGDRAMWLAWAGTR